MLYYNALIVGAAVACAVLASLSWRSRGTRSAPTFALLMAGVAVWGLAYALELASTTLAAKVLWSKVEYLGIVVVPVAWLAFALQHTGREHLLTRRSLALLAAPSALTLLLVWTNEAHRLIWATIRLVAGGHLMLWKASYGPAFWAFTGYAYLLLLLGSLLLCWTIVRWPGLYRGQASALLAGVAAPWAANAIYNLGLSPAGIELAPLAFAITGLSFAWALYRWRLLDVVPVARDTVFDSISDGVLVLDARGRIVDINPAACRIVRRARQELVGQEIERVLSRRPDLFERFRGRDAASEEVSLGADGVERVYHTRLTPICERGGRVSGRLVVLSDITASKRTERALLQRALELGGACDAAHATTRAVSAYLAMVSQEIRIPTSGVLGATALLEESGLTAQQQELVQTIRVRTDTLLTAVDEILDASQIEAGQLRLEIHPFDLRECLESALGMLAPQAAQKGLKLTCAVDAAAPRRVLADGARLRQVLVNLLAHAVRVTDRGEVAVSVHPGEHVGAAETISFAVRGSGPGIPAELAERRLHPFSNADEVDAPGWDRAGLDLMISRRIVELMGGAMWLEHGAGTTVAFTLRAPAGGDEPGTGEPPALAELRGRRALIVDANPANRRVLTLQLAAWEMAPVAAATVGEALDRLIGSGPFDLAILDAPTPRLDLLALAERIHAIPSAASLPLVALVTPDEGGPRPKQLAAVLTKPIKSSELYDALLAALARAPRPVRLRR